LKKKLSDLFLPYATKNPDPKLSKELWGLFPECPSSWKTEFALGFFVCFSNRERERERFYFFLKRETLQSSPIVTGMYQSAQPSLRVFYFY
jgi:hypothetical protein